MKIKIEGLEKERWQEFKELRLEALREEPCAFGRTYEEELKFKKNAWANSMERFIFAFDDNKLVGMIGHKFSKQKNAVIYQR